MPKIKGKGRFSKRWVHLIGLTGGLGSGKSTALSFFKKKRVFTLDADAIVHDLLKKKSVLKKILKTFGSNVFDKPSRLNRRQLAAVVFRSPTKRKSLEKILHPSVRREMKARLDSKKGRMAVLDIPLLFESGWKKRLDAVIVVTATNSVRIKRLKKKGFSDSDIRARIKAQMPLSAKVKKADYVIRNNGTKASTAKQVNTIYKKILNS